MKDAHREPTILVDEYSTTYIDPDRGIVLGITPKLIPGTYLYETLALQCSCGKHNCAGKMLQFKLGLN